MGYQLDYTGEETSNLLDDLNDKSSVNAYLSASADTTMTGAITWYPIQGTFTNIFENFVIDIDQIKYTGLRTYQFEIDFHAKLASDTASATTNIAVAINGVPMETEKMGVFLKFSGEPGNISGTAIVELSTDDTVQLVVQTDKANSVLTFGNFVATATKFIASRS